MSTTEEGRDKLLAAGDPMDANRMSASASKNEGTAGQAADRRTDQLAHAGSKEGSKEGLHFFIPRGRRLLTTLLLFGLIVEWLLPLQQLTHYTELYRIGPIIAAIGGFLAVGMMVPPVGISLLLSGVIVAGTVSLIYSTDSSSLWAAAVRIVDAVRDDAAGVAGGMFVLSGETRTLLLIAGLGMMVSAIQSLVWLRQWGLGITALTLIYLLVLHSFLGLDVYAGAVRAIAEGLLLSGLLLAPRLERLFGVPLRGAKAEADGRMGWSAAWWGAACGMTLLLLAAGLLAGLGKPASDRAAPWAADATEWVRTHITEAAVTTAIRERSLDAIRDPAGRPSNALSWVGYGFDDTELGAPIRTKQTPLFTVTAGEPVYLRGESKSRYDGRGWLPEVQALEVLTVGEEPQVTAAGGDAAGSTGEMGDGQLAAAPQSGGVEAEAGQGGLESQSVAIGRQSGDGTGEEVTGSEGAAAGGQRGAESQSVGDEAEAGQGMTEPKNGGNATAGQGMTEPKNGEGNTEAGLVVAGAEAVADQGVSTGSAVRTAAGGSVAEQVAGKLAASADPSSRTITHTVTALQPEAGWPLLSAGADASIESLAEQGSSERLGEYRKDPASGALYAPTDSAVIETYTVQTRLPSEDPMVLRKAGMNSDPAGVKQAYTQLPAALPARVRELADYAAEGGGGGRYDTVKAIESFLKSSYIYSRSDTAVPAAGADFVDDFLFEQKKGYCVHFATAMVVMLRAEGIPARYVKGFAPGQPVTADGAERQYTVRASDAHAWVEVYFGGVGWVPFDPTPGITVASLAAADDGSGALSQGDADGGALRGELPQPAGTAAGAEGAARAEGIAGRAAMVLAAAVRAAESTARGAIALAHSAAGAAAARPWAVAGLAAGAIAAAALAAAAWRRRERIAFAGALHRYGSALDAGRHLAARGQFLELADRTWRELQERCGPRQAARTTREYTAALQLPPESAGLVAEFVRLDEQARYSAVWTQLPAKEELARLLTGLNAIGRSK